MNNDSVNNINNVNNNNLNQGYVYNSYRPTNINNEVIDEERKKYLLEKEAKIQKNKKRKKIISSVIGCIVFVFLVSYLFINFFRPVKKDERLDKDSIHYVTDLYYSDGRFYEKYLSDKEKKIYKVLMEDFKDLEPVTEFNCIELGESDTSSCVGTIYRVIDVILMEHPDLFWYRYSAFDERVTTESTTIPLRHRYVTKSKIYLYFVERRLHRKIDEIASNYEDLSDDKKVEAVYTWLGETTSYSTLIDDKAGTAWSALLDDDSVCAGFAAASSLVFQYMGIESHVVTGQTSGPHAWNFVKLDDGYYWYDSTVAGSRGPESTNRGFYDGLLFGNTSKYQVEIISLDDYKFGTKYIRN